ncbi:MAG: aldolase [Nocardioides sp.]|nr:aldolase [Nocardioides sp.]
MPKVDDLSAAELAHELAGELGRRLAGEDEALVARFPGERPGCQPVHTVYVPADQYDADVVRSWGERARQAMADHDAVLRECLGDAAAPLLPLVVDKLEREPIEDLRIDFEDGYGAPADAVEGADVVRAAEALAASQADASRPASYGIRIKSLERPTRRRALETLVGFIDHLLSASGGLDGFVVTLPKVTSVAQVEAMALACDRIEAANGLSPGTLRFEIQVETPQSVLGPDGTALIARMIHAAPTRVVGLHYGTYDYSAFCGIAAPYQSLEHPVADHAKAVMQAAAAGTGVHLSDGSTNVLPVGDSDQVRRAWALHLRLVRRSLERGFYQGWDLHPAQLPTRYAATYGFFRDGFADAAERLRRYAARSEGGILDEPATARALADFLVRGLECGALREQETHEGTGLEVAGLTALARPSRT